jgi:ATP-dependent DNA helicase PIF1
MRQKQALRVMLDGQSVFLTGAPGAGKTYVLNEFVKRAQKLHKTVAVTASTGIAATHIGGTTIHSWSGLGIRDRLTTSDIAWLKGNDRLRKRYNATDVLVIDEVSMLHGARLDMVNEACKLLRDNPKPFGGLQVILVGDLFQLPPVSRDTDKLDFMHTSAAWAELNPKICYLSEQHRQSGDALLQVLEAMRSGELEQEHYEIITGRLGKKPTDDAPVTRLYAHNIDVDAINEQHLRRLLNKSQTFAMHTKGAAPRVEQLARSVLAPETLELKVGAEVMFVANNFVAGFVNGSRGQVIGFEAGLPIVRLASGRRTLKVEPHSWSLSEDGRVMAEVVQLPLRLAWAITIHKSQGMSLDAAEMDLGKTFTPGMGYVALSRVRSLDGVYLSGINNIALQLQPEIFEFDIELRAASAALAKTVDDADDEAEESEALDTAPANPELYDALCSWRIKLARQRNVPAYVIAHNRTLEAVATRQPATPQQLFAVSGIGQRFVDSYGSEILALVARHAAPQST